jgi:hypothetical protein
MKIRVLLPFLALGALILIVGLACGTTKTPTSEPPTQQSQNNEPPATSTPEAPAYFTEEFTSSELPDWSYFLTGGDEKKVSIDFGNDKLTVDIEGVGVNYYIMYDPYTYTDVRLDARVTNRGQNTNNISFICRYTDKDWYEVSVSNGGEYVMWYAKWDESGVTASYGQMTYGGTDHIKTGKNTNDFAVTCIGNTLTLYVNGVEEGSYTDKDYALSEGQVGVNVSSFDTYPILIDFDYITISEP